MNRRNGELRPGTPVPRGFTLIEVMMVTAIIGLLSSVAIPGYQRMILRARTAERANIVPAIAQAAQDVITRDGKFPTNPCVGAANPPGAPGTFKRRLLAGQPGWKDIDLMIEGDVYYSYSFVGTNTPLISLTVEADGDLDGDGMLSTKTVQYTVSNGAMMPVVETPPSGQEDQLTF